MQISLGSIKHHGTSKRDLSPSQNFGPFQDGELSSTERIPSTASTTWSFHPPLWLPNLQHFGMLLTKTILSTAALWRITIVSSSPYIFLKPPAAQSSVFNSAKRKSINRGIRAEWVATAMTPWLYATATKRNFLVYFTGQSVFQDVNSQRAFIQSYN